MARLPDSFVLRPMVEADVPEAGRVWRSAFSAIRPEALERTPEEIAREDRRLVHLLKTDPAGSFVGESEGRLIAMAQSHIRGSVFVLATLGVDPEMQDRGIGQRLLDAALSYGSRASVRFIFSSADPRALHRYVTAGFALHPAATITARPGAREPMIGRTRSATGDAVDLDLVDRVDRAVRGASRRVDVEFWLELGARLLVDDRGGYALVNGARLVALAAIEAPCAEDLLVAVLTGAGAADEAIEISWVTAGQQWAFASAARAGASLRGHGAVFVQGRSAMPVPYLPNGLFG